MFYAVYDMKDYYVAYFDTQKELANWFGKTKNSMQSSVSRQTNKKIDHIRSNIDGLNYKVYKIEID